MAICYPNFTKFRWNQTENSIYISVILESRQCISSPGMDECHLKHIKVTIIILTFVLAKFGKMFALHK